jgi:hypothetical protein
VDKHKHHWIVYSTSIAPPTILVRCEACKVQGTVYQYSTDEWQAAYYAPSKPYLWQDGERVQLPLERR